MADTLREKLEKLVEGWYFKAGDSLLADLDEAREDIKALATALRTPWRSRSEAEAAWQRIRSRRLLEVSE